MVERILGKAEVGSSILQTDRLRLLHAEGAAEAARAGAQAREAARGSGVAWSGLGPDPHIARSPADLARAADLRLAALERWRISRPGRLLAALAAAERAVERLRAGVARGLSPDDARCAGALAELEAAAAAARQAMDAA